MNSGVPTDKPSLLIALSARLERADRDLSASAVAWLQATMTNDEQRARTKALGELWRRERLAMLYCEVMNKGGSEDVCENAVLMVALDECDPEAVPSFREWLERRQKGG